MRYAYYARAGSYSRSFNAEVAESEGRFPLTRAVPILARKLSITQRKARAYLEWKGTCEWHHVGKYANRVDYYDTNVGAEDYATWCMKDERSA